MHVRAAAVLDAAHQNHVHVPRDGGQAIHCGVESSEGENLLSKKACAWFTSKLKAVSGRPKELLPALRCAHRSITSIMKHEFTVPGGTDTASVCRSTRRMASLQGHVGLGHVHSRCSSGSVAGPAAAVVIMQRNVRLIEPHNCTDRWGSALRASVHTLFARSRWPKERLSVVARLLSCTKGNRRKPPLPSVLAAVLH